jgi:hypothetical protein
VALFDIGAPSISIASPADGATYTTGEVVNASYSCSDEAGGSGVASCNGAVAPGSPIDTSTTGSHTFSVTTADQAGNSGSQSVSYTVSDSGGGGAPSNAFTVGKLRGRTLSVNVASPGTILVSDANTNGAGASALANKKLLKASSASGGPGTISVKLKLTPLAGRTLRQKHRLKLRAAITFSPAGGTAASKTARRTLKGS